MEITEKLNILDSFLGSHSKAGNEYLYFCPFCNHRKKKLSINIIKGKYKCWVCDTAGNIRKLVRKKAPYEVFQRWKMVDGEVDLDQNLEDLFQDKEEKTEEILSLPPEFVTLSSKENSLARIRVNNFLKRRRVTPEDILYWKIGFCFDGEYKDRVIIPSFNINGDLNYFVGRTITSDKFMKYKNPSMSKDTIFNELNVDFDSEIILTEGIFDAIVAGQNAIPLLGSILREESKLFQKIVGYDTTVYLALDPDAAEKENNIMRALINYGIEAYKIEISPFKDAGSMTKEQFQARKREAKLITYDLIFQKEMEVA